MTTTPCLCETSATCPKIGPPNLGTSRFNEKSVSFWKNPSEFVENHLKDNFHRVFVCRFAFRPCFMVASHKHVEDFLSHSTDLTYNGLRDFVFHLFGHNILFAENEEAKAFKVVILRSMQTINEKQILERNTRKLIVKEFATSDPVIPYRVFKCFATSLILQTFLGVEENSSLIDNVSKLSTTHWHGIISVPMNVKIFSLASSTYSKAIAAKDELLGIIDQALREGKSEFLNQFSKEIRGGEMPMETLKNHILVFICALIPKAVASVLAFFVESSVFWREKYVTEEGDITDEDLENILLEVLRLFPPFFGSLRVATKDIDLGEFHVPKGYGIFCIYYAAHRDHDVFPRPDEFLPERWSSFNRNARSQVFSFGIGPTSCVGQQMMWNVLKFVASKLVKTFTWDDRELLPADVKWLPVARPKTLLPIIFKTRDPVP